MHIIITPTTTNVAITSTTEQMLSENGSLTPASNSSTNIVETTVEMLTTIANNVTATLIETTINEPIATTATTLSITYMDSLPTTPYANLTSSEENSTVTTNIVNTTAAEVIDFVTLAPMDTSTLITTLTNSTSLLPATVTESTNLIPNTTVASVTTNNYAESVLSTIISSVDNSSVLQKDTLTSTEKTSCK